MPQSRLPVEDSYITFIYGTCVLDIKRMFHFFTELLFGIFFGSLNIWRVTLETRAGTHVKRPSLLPDFNQNWNVTRETAQNRIS